MMEKLEGLEGVECQIDDILAHDENQKQHDQRLDAVLKRLSDSNITLNLKKLSMNSARQL